MLDFAKRTIRNGSFVCPRVSKLGMKLQPGICLYPVPGFWGKKYHAVYSQYYGIPPGFPVRCQYRDYRTMNSEKQADVSLCGHHGEPSVRRGQGQPQRDEQHHGPQHLVVATKDGDSPHHAKNKIAILSVAWFPRTMESGLVPWPFNFHSVCVSTAGKVPQHTPGGIA